MSLIYFLVTYCMFTVTPVGDSCITKLLRKCVWFTIICNINWWFYLKVTIFGLPLLLFNFVGLCFWFSLFLFPFSSLDLCEFLYEPHGPLREFYECKLAPLLEQAGKKKKKKNQRLSPDLKLKRKVKDKCLNIQRSRDKKYYDPLYEQSGFSVNLDQYVKELSLLESLRRILFSVTDKSGLISAIFMYTQAHSQKSLFGHLFQIFSRSAGNSNGSPDEIRAFMDEFLESDIFGEQSGTTELAWITELRACFTDWKRYKNTKIAGSFLNLVNYIVSVGLCDKAKLTFSIGNLTLFAPIVSKRQLNAIDLFDLITETALGFLEGAGRVYSNKSISSFFIEEDLFISFEQAYNNIREIHGFSLTGNLRKHAGIDENEYELRLDSAVMTGEKLLKKLGNTSSFERKFISDRLDKIHDYRNEFVQVRTRGGLRVAPFGVSLYGDSAVGKSTLNQITYEAIGTYNKIDVSAERVATWADNDKFASNIRASTNVIIFDDFANTAPKFMDFSPCYRLIQCVNNALFTAPMAEANLKGKVGLHPWIVMITTNVEHLMANVYSKKPESILRRFYHAKVELLEEFSSDGKLDENKVFKRFGAVKIPNVWKISVRTCVVGDLKATGSDERAYSLSNVFFEGKELKEIDVHTYLRWAQVTSKKHYDQQRNLIETMRTPAADVCELCGFFGCSCPKIVECAEIPLEVEDVLEENAGFAFTPFRFFLFILRVYLGYSWSAYMWALYMWIHTILRALSCRFSTSTVENMTSVYFQQMDSKLGQLMRYSRLVQHYLNVQLNSISTMLLLDMQEFYNSHWVFDFIMYIPDSWVNTNVYMMMMLYQQRFQVIFRQRFLIILTLLCYSLCVYNICHGSFYRGLLQFVALIYIIGVIAASERITLQQELLRRRAVAPATIRWLRNHYLLAFCGLVGGLYTCLSMIKRARRLDPQGNLQPSTMTDIDERDKEVNPWAELVVSPLPLTTASKTTTCDDLVTVASRNLVNIESSHLIVKGFFLSSNLLVVPFHYITKHREMGIMGDIRIKCYRTGKNKVGGNFHETLSETYSYRIPKTDFIVFYSPASGSVANLMKFLPTDLPCTTDARFITKNEECDIIVHPILFEAQSVEHTSMRFYGGRYTLPVDTYQGLCMSPIVSRGKGSAIIGFHLCGKNKNGGAGSITQAQAEMAALYIGNLDGVVLACSNGVFPKEQYGYQTIVDTNVHRKSATRYISPDNSLEVYGTTTGMATPASSVCDTVISPFVAEVTGVPQQWGPPKMFGRGIYPYQTALETLSHPSLSLGSFIRPAVVCYRSIFPVIKQRVPELFRQAKPLTNVETVSGIDGRRFIDAMNFKTSPGWPLSGRKDKWIIDLDPKDYPHISRPRTFVPEIWDEVKRTCSIMRSGERPYFIWKACLKDEPTKLTKTKVRVFQSAPIALQLIIRMYFLPIVRIIQCNPLDAECLVGANAEGPEWEQLNNFMTSKGPNILAGDYSKYDQRMPSQLVIAAFDVLIWIAKELCDYPMDAIMIMRGVVGEVAFPLMSYNGDLLQLFGSNPSGQNLTVVINSIANVLLMRSCYYHFYPQDIDRCLFRKYCAMATYGDDVKGSIAPERPLFNHISFAEFLADFNIVFTMPDKESVATRYMNADEADFLKRNSRYHEDLRINVGVLSEVSIFKRLHSHLLSKELSLEMQSAVNIDSSLHDWFYYGRDMFEFRKKQLVAISVKAGVYHLCRGFDVSYDQRVVRWNQKYRPQLYDEGQTVSVMSDSVLGTSYDDFDRPYADEVFVHDTYEFDTL